MCSHFVRQAFPFVTLLVTLSLGGCQPQTIVLGTASAEQPSGRPPMGRMLVLGARMGEGDRRAVESGFATGLRGNGVDAHPAFEIFPVPPTDRDQARATLTANGYDGVLIVALAKVEDEQCGELGNEKGGPCTHSRGGYMVTDRYVTIESTLWDVRGTDEIVWAAGTETINPSNRKQLAESVSRVVVPALSQARFILPRRG